MGCIGANGAGKSTLIKCLTGELEATDGNVWRHPNCRIAYVAQHAFHHIEKHLDKTPNQYIQWRYVSGEDREEQEKSHIAMTEDEIAKMHEKIKMDDGSKRAVEKLVSRRKAKGGGYEYAPLVVVVHVCAMVGGRPVQPMCPVTLKPVVLTAVAVAGTRSGGRTCPASATPG